MARLRRMQELDADILKIAVMLRSKKDVLTLLAATEEMCSEYANRPVITMSMDGMGLSADCAGGVRFCGDVRIGREGVGAGAGGSRRAQACVYASACYSISRKRLFSFNFSLYFSYSL